MADGTEFWICPRCGDATIVGALRCKKCGTAFAGKAKANPLGVKVDPKPVRAGELGMSFSVTFDGES